MDKIVPFFIIFLLTPIGSDFTVLNVKSPELFFPNKKIFENMPNGKHSDSSGSLPGPRQEALQIVISSQGLEKTQKEVTNVSQLFPQGQK